MFRREHWQLHFNEGFGAHAGVESGDTAQVKRSSADGSACFLSIWPPKISAHKGQPCSRKTEPTAGRPQQIPQEYGSGNTWMKAIRLLPIEVTLCEVLPLRRDRKSKNAGAALQSFGQLRVRRQGARAGCCKGLLLSLRFVHGRSHHHSPAAHIDQKVDLHILDMSTLSACRMLGFGVQLRSAGHCRRSV
jgi:hypothetical protein